MGEKSPVFTLEEEVGVDVSWPLTLANCLAMSNQGTLRERTEMSSNDDVIAVLLPASSSS
jgi:hypothetical protein